MRLHDTACSPTAASSALTPNSASSLMPSCLLGREERRGRRDRRREVVRDEVHAVQRVLAVLLRGSSRWRWWTTAERAHARCRCRGTTRRTAAPRTRSASTAARRTVWSTARSGMPVGLPALSLHCSAGCHVVEEQRGRADQRERVAARRGDGVLRVVGGQLRVERLHDDLAAGEPAVGVDVRRPTPSRRRPSPGTGPGGAASRCRRSTRDGDRRRASRRLRSTPACVVWHSSEVVLADGSEVTVSPPPTLCPPHAVPVSTARAIPILPTRRMLPPKFARKLGCCDLVPNRTVPEVTIRGRHRLVASMLLAAMGTACGGGATHHSTSPVITAVHRVASAPVKAVAPPAIIDRGGDHVAIARSLLLFGRWLEWHPPDPASVAGRTPTGANRHA